MSVKEYYSVHVTCQQPGGDHTLIITQENWDDIGNGHETEVHCYACDNNVTVGTASAGECAGDDSMYEFFEDKTRTGTYQNKVYLEYQNFDQSTTPYSDFKLIIEEKYGLVEE